MNLAARLPAALLAICPLLFMAHAPAQAQTAGEPAIRQERVLEDLLQMLKIRSQSRNERALADRLKAALTDLGAQVHEDQAQLGFKGNTGNVYGLVKGTLPNAPVLLLNAHMDTVEPSEGVEPRIEGGVIKASGKTILGADDKAGIAAILEALRVLKERKLPHGDLLVVFTAAEEAGVLGAKHADPAWIRRAALGFALDGSGAVGDVSYSAIGAVQLNIVMHGRGAHAGNEPEKGISAIGIAAQAIASVPTGRLDAATTSNIGTLHCGTAVNIVPDRCELIVGVRAEEPARMQAEAQKIADAFTRAAAERGGRAEVEVVPVLNPFRLQQDSPPIQLALRAGRALGLQPAMRASGGGSDANFFNAYGVPTAVIAMGNGNKHAVDESMPVDALYRSAELVLQLVQQASQMK